MADPDVPEGVSVEQDRDTVSATTVVPAPPAEVFDFIRRPANHAIISGDGTVTGTTTGPEVLGEGDRFGMSMKQGVPYRMSSQVKELTHGTKIAWAHVGGHRWRWELEATADGQTTLTETFDLSTSKLPFALRLVGFPGRHRTNVARSVANVRDHFAS
jgi:hypothetical protein